MSSAGARLAALERRIARLEKLARQLAAQKRAPQPLGIASQQQRTFHSRTKQPPATPVDERSRATIYLRVHEVAPFIAWKWKKSEQLSQNSPDTDSDIGLADVIRLLRDQPVGGDDINDANSRKVGVLREALERQGVSARAIRKRGAGGPANPLSVWWLALDVLGDVGSLLTNQSEVGKPTDCDAWCARVASEVQPGLTLHCGTAAAHARTPLGVFCGPAGLRTRNECAHAWVNIGGALEFRNAAGDRILNSGMMVFSRPPTNATNASGAETTAAAHTIETTVPKSITGDDTAAAPAAAAAAAALSADDSALSVQAIEKRMADVSLSRGEVREEQAGDEEAVVLVFKDKHGEWSCHTGGGLDPLLDTSVLDGAIREFHEETYGAWDNSRFGAWLETCPPHAFGRVVNQGATFALYVPYINAKQLNQIADERSTFDDSKIFGDGLAYRELYSFMWVPVSQLEQFMTPAKNRLFNLTARETIAYLRSVDTRAFASSFERGCVAESSVEALADEIDKIQLD